MTPYQHAILISSIFLAVANKDQKGLLTVLSAIWLAISIVASATSVL